MPVGRGEKTDSFKLHTFNHLPGDTIYVCTDGYADQFGGPKGKKFKYKKLEELLLHASGLPPDKQRDLIHHTFQSWKGKLDQVDDVCIIGISI
jgi:serine phosphatase RsbU (regulator of sigma subunit)